MSNKPEDVQELEVKERMLSKSLKGKNFLKIIAILATIVFGGLIIIVALSGFECNDGKRSIKKEATKLPYGTK